MYFYAVSVSERMDSQELSSSDSNVTNAVDLSLHDDNTGNSLPLYQSYYMLTYYGRILFQNLTHLDRCRSI